MSREVPVDEIVAGDTIVDLDGREINVIQVWPNQGEGLGVVVNGEYTNFKPEFEGQSPASHNRYIDPKALVVKVN